MSEPEKDTGPEGNWCDLGKACDITSTLIQAFGRAQNGWVSQNVDENRNTLRVAIYIALRSTLRHFPIEEVLVNEVDRLRVMEVADSVTLITSDALPSTKPVTA